MALRKIAELHPHPILARRGLTLEEIRRCGQAVEGSPRPEPLEMKFLRMRMLRDTAPANHRFR